MKNKVLLFIVLILILDCTSENLQSNPNAAQHLLALARSLRREIACDIDVGEPMV
jgi:hypothetical protein